jgi:hypothetical protein
MDGWIGVLLGGIAFCIGTAVGSWKWDGIHCKTKGIEGSVGSYALGDSLASATSAEIK